MAAMLIMLRCVVLRLLSPHPLVCRGGRTAKVGVFDVLDAAKSGDDEAVELLVIVNDGAVIVRDG